jgi:hypothetical protein
MDLGVKPAEPGSVTQLSDIELVTRDVTSKACLVCTIEELIERKRSGSGLENRDYGLGMRRADYVTPLICKSWY